MNQSLLKLINQIKDDIRSLDDEGISHPIIDSMYEKLTELEDMVYEQDNTNSEDADYYE